MTKLRGHRRRRWLWVWLIGLVAAGCVTQPRIDWAGRVGHYTYDQAVLEFGPPDKYAKLNDGTAVAEWLLRHGYAYASSPFYGYSTSWYGPYFPAYIESYTSPSYYLRLIFTPDGQLKGWKHFYK